MGSGAADCAGRGRSVRCGDARVRSGCGLDRVLLATGHGLVSRVNVHGSVAYTRGGRRRPSSSSHRSAGTLPGTPASAAKSSRCAFSTSRNRQRIAILCVSDGVCQVARPGRCGDGGIHLIGTGHRHLSGDFSGRGISDGAPVAGVARNVQAGLAVDPWRDGPHRGTPSTATTQGEVHVVHLTGFPSVDGPLGLALGAPCPGVRDSRSRTYRASSHPRPSGGFAAGSASLSSQTVVTWITGSVGCSCVPDLRGIGTVRVGGCIDRRPGHGLQHGRLFIPASRSSGGGRDRAGMGWWNAGRRLRAVSCVRARSPPVPLPRWTGDVSRPTPVKVFDPEVNKSYRRGHGKADDIRS